MKNSQFSSLLKKTSPVVNPVPSHFRLSENHGQDPCTPGWDDDTYGLANHTTGLLAVEENDGTYLW